MHCKVLSLVDDLGQSYAHSHTLSINPATQEAEGEAGQATNSVLAAHSFQISTLTFMI